MDEVFRLDSSSQSRAKAVAVDGIESRKVILSSRPLATVLSTTYEGKRCNHCLKSSSSLATCSRCKTYRYCGPECQLNDWLKRHKRICKTIVPLWNVQRQELRYSHFDILDGTLLIHLFSEHRALLLQSSLTAEDFLSPCSVLWHLLPGTGSCLNPDILSDIARTAHWDMNVIRHLLPRFRNNNFEIHSGLEVIAHGIFPLASRSFNHSCRPNAVPVYNFDEQGLRQDIVAIRQISTGEEITISYLDPALSYQERQQHLYEIYGFKCNCSFCKFHEHVVSTYPTADFRPSCQTVEKQLLSTEPHHWEVDFEDLPPDLFGIFDGFYLPSISAAFSKFSHEGPFVKAIEKGKALSSLYRILYPCDYPMIGYHELELAKTMWNCVACDDVLLAEERSFLEKILERLRDAEAILNVTGGWSEPGGWNEQVQYLRDLIVEAL